MSFVSASFHHNGRGIVTILSACVMGGCGGGAVEGAPTPGVRNDTIYIGALTPLSDAVAVIGKPMLAGLTTYFDRVNAEEGGIAGRYTVRVIAEDVTYANPSTSTQKYQKIKGDVALFGMVVGTDNVNGLLPLLAEDSVIAMPTTFDAEWVRNPNLLSWGTPYQLQAINGVSYYREKYGKDRKICSLVLATGYGEATEEGLEYLAQDAGFTVVAKARFKQDDQDFVAPITQLKNAGCEAVMLAALPGVTGKVLGTAAQLSFAPRWIATSPSWHHALAASPIRDYLERNFWTSWDGPALDDTTVAGNRVILASMAKYAPQQQPDFYFNAGFILAYGLHRLMEEAVAAGDLSRSGFMRAMTSLGTVSSDGLLGDYTYGPTAQRNPPRTGTIFRVEVGAPIGLVVERAGVTSEAAQRYVFPSAER
jgi:ABC-type branched-subunit amino acid transport system substrate-binding protein